MQMHVFYRHPRYQFIRASVLSGSFHSPYMQMEATGVLCSKAAAGRVSLEGSETFVEANSHKVTQLPTNLSVWERACKRWCLFVSGWGAKVSTVKVSVDLGTF